MIQFQERFSGGTVEKTKLSYLFSKFLFSDVEK